MLTQNKFTRFSGNEANNNNEACFYSLSSSHLCPLCLIFLLFIFPPLFPFYTPPLYFPFLLHFFLPLCLFRPFLPRSSILSTPSISSFCIPFVSNEFLQRKIRLWHSFKKIFFSFSSLQCSIVNRFMLTQL